MRYMDLLNNWPDLNEFSGVISISGEQGIIFEKYRRNIYGFQKNI